MFSRRTLLALAVVLWACSRDPEPERGPSNFQLLRGESWKTSHEPDQGHASVMVDLCCPRKLSPLMGSEVMESELACRELQRMIEVGPRDDAVFYDWGPRCYQRIQTSSLVVAMRNGASLTSQLASILRDAEPTPELVEQLLEIRASTDDDSRVRFARSVLRRMPDRELSVVTRDFDSDDPARVVRALELVAGQRWSLEIPQLERLNQLEVSFDVRIGQLAQAIQRERPGSLDEQLAVVTSRFESPSAVDDYSNANTGMSSRAQWKRDVRSGLSRRMVFCSSPVATGILAALRADSDPAESYLAERAIRLRVQRCGDRLDPSQRRDLPFDEVRRGRR